MNNQFIHDIMTDPNVAAIAILWALTVIVGLWVFADHIYRRWGGGRGGRWR